MKITPQSIVVASREQLSSATDGETVIAGLRSGRYYRLEGVAARVWELVQVPAVVAGLPLAIAREYDVSAEACRDDVMVLLEELAEDGLIEVNRVS